MVVTQELLKRTPLPIAVLDANLRFLACSDFWKQHVPDTDSLLGKPFKETMPELPEELYLDFHYCLEGVEHRTDTLRFVDSRGHAFWYEWKVNSWLGDAGEVNGLIVILEDRTAQKRNEELLERAQEVARIGGWEVDLIKGTMYWSRITKEIHEVPEDFEPNLETGINFYKEGESRDTITRLVGTAMEKGQGWDTELQIITATGKELWVRAKGEAELLDGKCVRLTGTFQDIDKRKKAELEFNALSHRLQMATQTSGIGIWEHNLSTEEVIWDANMYAIYGIRREDFASAREAWDAVAFLEDKDPTVNKVRQAMERGEDVSTMFRAQRPDGDIRWIKAFATTVKDTYGKPVKMLGVNWDITELRNTQLQLQQSEASLKGAFENSRVGMALVGMDGRFMDANPSLCDSLGYSREGLLAKTFQEITHPEDLDADLEMLGEVMEGKRETYQIEKRYIHRNGNIVYVYLTVTGVKDIHGKLSHFISQIVDITSRTEAENRLKHLLDLTGKQNESLVNFAHIVSHNLRSHATNLSMLTQLLINDKIEEGQKEYALNMLHKAADGLHETIEHLNEVVQVKVIRNENLKALNLSKIVEKVLVDLNTQIRQSQTTLQMEIPAGLKVRGVSAYAESILLNLISNALKYRHPDKANRIEIRAVDTGETVTVTIADNGLGIDMARHQRKLFGMYKTFHNNKDAKGIGLFITKNQIESMGGKIHVTSMVNEGSTFTVEFLKSK
ncbi:PAS domain S-box protein [Robiginitalea sp. M366]|uniref:PAS domain-containing sensor histidine kinase n=1 Tax=Robiginitalea aestuariiviva TaxID=3036903 RepID=UPI00240D4035|nr:PAS domain S-box protein [Robiginitalea aestuariiviva]MDG1571149.1 PAS domain S-box protein [Robiginitalea aestuariiviva]